MVEKSDLLEQYPCCTVSRPNFVDVLVISLNRVSLELLNNIRFKAVLQTKAILASPSLILQYSPKTN